ncbi:unnamed protein product [Vitrella brassicaformis CCMP3155]|uniref:Amine oxidase n=2 Tax=Vitrella brassicaformis TaxID=1169539 RepID=A0A0G4EZP7_VITBC|nr:unnamed protein product [Vitrella brassicaformis CCMP3155]|mmetsp:Transcript_27228/g.67906  ORF Transcript_27228/g.67906 Transcript_27228/m.67906 type:complete len:876 (+) Transcript_27228:118-2745(+)|eukprot:CEM04618.1 unnamed protein product [Vitrella brassicaformis CCMP3155]
MPEGAYAAHYNGVKSDDSEMTRVAETRPPTEAGEGDDGHMVGEARPLVGQIQRKSRLRTGMLMAGCIVLGAAVGSLVTYAVSTLSGSSMTIPSIPFTTPGGGERGVSSASVPPPVFSAVWSGEDRDRNVIFDELSPAEIKCVLAHVGKEMGVAAVYDPTDGLNYAEGPEAVALYHPLKSEALQYVDGLTDTPPPRYAKVTVVREGRSAPDLVEVKVGPIEGSRDEPSIPAGSPITQLTDDGHITYTRRPGQAVFNAREEWFVNRTLAELEEVLTESFGNVWPQFDSWDPKMGVVGGFLRADIQSTDASRISRTLLMWFPDEAHEEVAFVHPVPLSFRVNNTARDPKEWTAFDFKYCGQAGYQSAAALLAAYRKSTLSRCKYTFTSSLTWDMTRGGYRGQDEIKAMKEKATVARRLAENRRFEKECRMKYLMGSSTPTMRGTELFLQAGPKYLFGGQQVSGLGWDFFMTVRPSRGLDLRNLKFKGQRIAYELSFQASHADYAGEGHEQFFYADEDYTMSQWSANLIPGVDCPYDATYINFASWMQLWDPSKADWFVAACVFTHSSGSSIWRHTEPFLYRPSGLAAESLVVRQVATVGNYDYIMEVHFYPDGSAQVMTTLAGYMETHWYHPDFNPSGKAYSTIVHKNLAAPLHTHLTNWKVDLDVHGTQNRLEKTMSKVGYLDAQGTDQDGQLSAWPADVRSTNPLLAKASPPPSKYLKEALVTHEGAESQWTMDFHSPSVWRVVNAHATPIEGTENHPGYAIVPLTTNLQVLPKSHPFAKVARFADNHVTFTKRKDWECCSTSLYDMWVPSSPVHNSSLGFYVDDGDSLVDEDLVAWVTIGKEHITRSEDLPLIHNMGSAFYILPWNYFPYLPVMP